MSNRVRIFENGITPLDEAHLNPMVDAVNNSLPTTGGQMTGNIEFSDTGTTVGNWRGIF